jgi:uncharacterized protein involved in exopolysaccharide biosynthesis
MAEDLTPTAGPREAAEAEPPVTPASPAMDPHQSREEAERRVARLEIMIQEQDEAIAKKQSEMDKMDEAMGGATAQIETLRKLEALRLEALSEYRQVGAVYDYLRNLPRASLLKTIPTSSPDPLLTTLMEQKSAAEQKLAQLSVNHGPEHPEMKGLRDLLATITRQIDERLDGMLQGLKGKTESYSTKLRELQDEIDTAKKREIQSSIIRRPYLKAKREIETMETFRDRLWLRLQEQRVDAALLK